MRHVGKAHAEAVVIRPGQRIRSLQVDVVADEHQCALLVVEINPARRIGQDDGANSHAPEHARRKSNFLRGISFIKMYASLHHGHGDGARPADHHLPGVADRGGSRERGDVGVRSANRVGERIGKPTQPGAENKPNARAQGSLSEDESGSGFGGGVRVVHAEGRQYFF